MTTRMLGGLLAIVLAGCSGLSLGPINPVAGTWYFATRNPGVTFTGRIEFDHTGDLASMEVTSVNGTEQFVFDGRAHKGDNGDYQTATATTTLTDDQLRVRARVEHTEGKYEGVTYITVEATVGFGEMSGLLKIAPPNSDSGTFDFDATRH
jgi:multidrug efflux pump subunit AcrA (membrane-fusion protein)